MSSNDPYQHQNQRADMQHKIKVLGFMPIYYAGSYLKESLISVVDHVDKMVIAHTQTPSHGHKSSEPCPDTAEYIYNICLEVLGDKLIWHSAPGYSSEAEHREMRYKYAEDYHIILNVDSDEIMLDIPKAIDYVLMSNARYFGIKGYINFFRSHSWCCLDGFRPIRFEQLQANNTRQDLECEMTVLHFSLCQSRSIMELKYKVFGHASEVRPNYLEEIFYKWSSENNIPDLHPVALGLWNAVPFDKNLMPWYLQQHINHNKHIIE